MIVHQFLYLNFCFMAWYSVELVFSGWLLYAVVLVKAEISACFILSLLSPSFFKLYIGHGFVIFWLHWYISEMYCWLCYQLLLCNNILNPLFLREGWGLKVIAPAVFYYSKKHTTAKHTLCQEYSISSTISLKPTYLWR